MQLANVSVNHYHKDELSPSDWTTIQATYNRVLTDDEKAVLERLLSTAIQALFTMAVK